MSTALAEPAVREQAVQHHRARRPCGGRGITLAQLLATAQEALELGATADCPVCGGAMHPSPIEAQCKGCGARLA